MDAPAGGQHPERALPVGAAVRVCISCLCLCPSQLHGHSLLPRNTSDPLCAVPVGLVAPSPGGGLSIAGWRLPPGLLLHTRWEDAFCFPWGWLLLLPSEPRLPSFSSCLVPCVPLNLSHIARVRGLAFLLGIFLMEVAFCGRGRTAQWTQRGTRSWCPSAATGRRLHISQNRGLTRNRICQRLKDGFLDSKPMRKCLLLKEPDMVFSSGQWTAAVEIVTVLTE